VPYGPTKLFDIPIYPIIKPPHVPMLYVDSVFLTLKRLDIEYCPAEPTTVIFVTQQLAVSPIPFATVLFELDPDCPPMKIEFLMLAP
jgi:hypothetical protein